MASRRLLFTVLYRLGFTPWDGHPLAASLRELVAGPAALLPGRALDVGCGTGDNCLYLARHGWQATGVDFVAKALDKARAKAAAAGVDVTFLPADATRLTSAGVGSGFHLIVDSGCLHGMSDADRDAYVAELTQVAAPDARLLIVAFPPGASFGVPGIAGAEVEQRFAAGWTLLASGDEDAARYYLFARAS